MPRGRMVNKCITTDEKVAKLSLKGTLFYTWCIPFLDIKGRLIADLYLLKAIFPFISEITTRNIPYLIKELITADLVIYYGNGKHKYLQFKGFKKNQNLREDREAPSIIPAPTQELIQSNDGVTPAKDKLSKDKIREGVNPSLLEVQDYIRQKGYNVDPVQFFNYYAEADWHDKEGHKVKSWKQRVITWHGRQKKEVRDDSEKELHRKKIAELKRGKE